MNGNPRIRKCNKYDKFCEFMLKDGCGRGNQNCPECVVKMTPFKECPLEVQQNRIRMFLEDPNPFTALMLGPGGTFNMSDDME